MSQRIVSRTFNYGDEKESSWPPQFGTGGSGVYYWDKDARKFKEGFPPQNIKRYGEAPLVITDSIEPFYHQGACAMVDSRSRLKDIDAACGTITTDKLQPADPSWAKAQQKRRHEDLKESLHKSIAQIDSGNAPLTEEQRAACERQNEIISKALNYDAFNVAGRKDNAKGKRFRSRNRK